MGVKTINDIGSWSDSYKYSISHKLRKAAFFNEKETLLNILKHNSKINHSTRWINEYDKFGWSAIHYACFQGNLDICKYLINAGADVNLQTERAKESPLFIAAGVNEHSIVKYFVNKTSADPNLGDITGRIPLEVSYGTSFDILSEERLKHGKLIRLIPTIRKLLASKFTQLLLQLILCIFLELFQVKLISVLHKALQLVALLGPGVRQFIVGVFDRMLAPIFVPLINLLSPLLIFIISPILIILNSIFQQFQNSILVFLLPILTILGNIIKDFFSPIGTILNLFFTPLWNIIVFLFSNSFQFISLSFKNIISILNIIITPILGVLIYPFKLFLNAFIFTIRSSLIYSHLQRLFSYLYTKSWKILWFTLQPKQLAGKLVSPIIIGASKILYIFPSSIIDYIAHCYTRIAGKSRHVSDEEVATATLFLAGLGIYIFGILIGGYICRILLFIMYHFDWYGGELHALSNIFVVFSDSNYTTLEWKPDGQLHELGLLITTIILPILIIIRLLKFIILFIYRQIFCRKEIQQQKEKKEKEKKENEIHEKHNKMLLKSSKMDPSPVKSRRMKIQSIPRNRIASMPVVDGIKDKTI